MHALGALDLEAWQQVHAELSCRSAQLIDPGDIVVLGDADELDAARLGRTEVTTRKVDALVGLFGLWAGSEGRIEWRVNLQVGPQEDRTRPLFEQRRKLWGERCLSFGGMGGHGGCHVRALSIKSKGDRLGKY